MVDGFCLLLVKFNQHDIVLWHKISIVYLCGILIVKTNCNILNYYPSTICNNSFVFKYYFNHFITVFT